MGFFRNLFGDMQTRGLLLPAILLVVALIAIPMLLRDPTEAVIPPAPPPSDDTPSQTSPAAFADTVVGIRDYQERLREFKSKNPFKQKFTSIPDSGDDSGSGGSGSGGGSGGGSVTPPPDPTPPPLPPPPTLITMAVDVTVGRLDGSMKTMKGVEPFTILPSEKRPVLAFLGATLNASSAAFSVANDARVVRGLEYCLPSPESCLYLTLSPGESARVEWPAAEEGDPDEGPIYRIKLSKIRTVVQSADGAG